MAVRKDLPNRNTGRNTLMLDHFTRREHRCRPGPSQAWLRRFNSAFVSRWGCKHCSDAVPILNRDRARGSTVATHHSQVRRAEGGMRRRPRTPARILIPHSAFRTRMPRGVISSVPVSETGNTVLQKAVECAPKSFIYRVDLAVWTFRLAARQNSILTCFMSANVGNSAGFGNRFGGRVAVQAGRRASGGDGARASGRRSLATSRASPVTGDGAGEGAARGAGQPGRARARRAAARLC
jgi:hypothetical protein